MVSLLIVDDEMSVVEGLAINPWEEIGVDNIYKANSAKEALEILNVSLVDIVITDIRMPEMNGIELIKRIRTNWENTKCILLSGYEEFDYAKQAVQQDAFDYLLKPVDDDEIMESVKKAAAVIQKKWAEVSSYEKTFQTLKENLPLIKENLLKELLQGRRLLQQELKDKMRLMGIPFSWDDPYALMLVRIEEGFSHFGPQGESLLEYAIGNIIDEVFKSYFDIWKCRDDHRYLVVLLKHHDNNSLHDEDGNELSEQIIGKLAQQLQESVVRYLKGNVSIVISDWEKFPKYLTHSYHRNISLFRKRIGDEKGVFLFSAQDEQASFQPIQGLYEPPMLHHLLEAGRWEFIDDKLNRVFTQLRMEEYQSKEQILEVFFLFSHSLTYIANRNGRILEEIMDHEMNKLLLDLPNLIISDIEKWVYRMIALIKADLEKDKKGGQLRVVKQVQDYIEQHLDTNVSLQAISDHVYLHPTYLSKVYKTETGEGISEYIHRLRMEKAAYQLTYSQEKIYKISDQLGYQTTSYFIRVFKKHFGVTPQDYRNNN